MRSINLEDIINELELISDDGISYLHKLSGELIHLTSFEIKNSLINSTKAKIDLSNENFAETDYLKLPSKKEFSEHDLMLNFLRNNPNQYICEEVTKLENEHNTNYWRLRNLILHFNIGNEWYKYKREAFQKIAIDWCNKNIDSIPNSILQEIRMNNHV